MLGRLYKTQDCSAARALELVGERWSLLIIRDAIFRRTTRFSDFQRNLGIASNILTSRLDHFGSEGLMEAEHGNDGAGHRVYHLTEKGQALAPVIVALTEWGAAWIDPGPVTFQHTGCGGDVHSRLVCDACGEDVGPGSVMPKLRQTP